MLDHDAEFTTVDQMLDGLEAFTGRQVLLMRINTPPLTCDKLEAGVGGRQSQPW